MSRNDTIRTATVWGACLVYVCVMLGMVGLPACSKSKKKAAGKAGAKSPLQGTWRVDTDRLGELEDVKGASDEPVGGSSANSVRAAVLKALRKAAETTTMVIGPDAFNTTYNGQLERYRYRVKKRSGKTWTLEVFQKRPWVMTAVLDGDRLTLKRANGAVMGVFKRRK